MGYASMVAGLLCVPLAIKYFRDQLNQGLSTFGEGMKIGVGVSLIASVMMFFYTVLFFTFAWDDFLAWYQASLSDEEWELVEAQMATMPEYMMTPWFNGIILFLTVLIIGLIMAVISSLLLKSTTKTASA